MELILILGPMKSGKSFELISYFMPLQYTDISFGLYQSSKNVRNENIWSRDGLSLVAEKIDDLSKIAEKDLKIIGIDEIHMFNEKNIGIIEDLLKKETKIIVSGLDTDYKGEMFPVIRKLLSFGPKEVKYKRAVCEICKNPDAVYTQIYKNSVPVLDGLPPVVPDDGRYFYKPVCRNCFIKKIIC
jgi:thymidine kinase